MTGADDTSRTTQIMPKPRSTFAVHTARDDAESLSQPSFHQASSLRTGDMSLLPYSNFQELQEAISDGITEETDLNIKYTKTQFSRTSHTAQSKSSKEPFKPRPGAPPRPAECTNKQGTFSSMFVTITFNVFSILVSLYFGSILGQTGIMDILGMLCMYYAINLLTTMLVPSIATHGTVNGRGAYYLISRSLGLEFGGGVGLVFSKDNFLWVKTDFRSVRLAHPRPRSTGRTRKIR
ncbi:hypothetical protein P153DRAFT_101773 [Dothidotthia symphoricarpi CBS 119687]|uniref:Amino acid permease/ SLC12A domain-containing protein n=1 Tax=Dothidotthia symphoricarpi CBS 119687 TaxID=1392245 RepID=A0A6A6ASY3_9PLEO|nr:uncharacterized protein P153DRAFT_101773 [Dothidotthia symphoricarpi CBS 119687]KAF2133957.1 hypothetical protein P153DRAFT_101773 [Dothidotthia symphoricarpi CBS 119687]